MQIVSSLVLVGLLLQRSPSITEYRKGFIEEKVRPRFKRICVFCGSSSRKKPSYQEAAIELGKELVLVVPMLAPRSYTREDVVELQCHGSDVCLHRVLRACLEAGARLAKPGEFTLCAFLNGRLDLSQTEDVGKLVSAKSVVAAGAALVGIQGGFSSPVKSLRSQCMELLTEIEA